MADDARLPAMEPTCPLCDGEHPSTACAAMQDDAVWTAPDPGDGETSPTAVTAAGTIRPLLAALTASEKEVAVLETVHTDEDQRRRLSRSRRLVRAIRHLRLGRQDELKVELEEAEVTLPNDPRTHLVGGFGRLMAGDLSGAQERFESVARRGEGDDRLDGLLLAGRCMIAADRCGDASALLERVAQEGEGLQRAEARYQLARCVVARMADGTSE